MGAKISVDSATMMNKGLELIEAASSLPGRRTTSWRSLVHRAVGGAFSLVEYVDGSVLAQLGRRDMRIPIAHALAWPDRMATPMRAARSRQRSPGSISRRPDTDPLPRAPRSHSAALDGRTARAPRSSTPRTRPRSPPSSPVGSASSTLPHVVAEVTLASI